MWPQAQRRRVAEGGYLSVLAPARPEAVTAAASV
jgi:hypothetical protein